MNVITNLVAKLQGFKTYMIATAAALTAVVAYLNHQIDLIQLVEVLFATAATATGRDAINTTAQKVINAQAAAASVDVIAPPNGVSITNNKPADPNDLG